MTNSRNATPLVIVTVVTIAFAFLNLDGYQLHLDANLGTPQGFLGMGDFAGEPPTHNWIHGWPIGFGKRSSIDKVDIHRTTSRWPFDGVPFDYFNWAVLVFDIAIAAIISIGAFFGARSFSRWINWQPRYSLRTMLAIVTLCAFAAVFRNQVFVSRYTLQFTMAAVAAVGVILCMMSLLAAAMCSGRLFVASTRRDRTTG